LPGHLLHVGTYPAPECCCTKQGIWIITEKTTLFYKKCFLFC
jgi:hypothetical protein